MTTLVAPTETLRCLNCATTSAMPGGETIEKHDLCVVHVFTKTMEWMQDLAADAETMLAVAEAAEKHVPTPASSTARAIAKLAQTWAEHQPKGARN